MKVIVFSKRDVITHPLAISLIKNWATIGDVEYYTIYSELSVDNCAVHAFADRKYLDFKQTTRYLMTLRFYIKLLRKLSSLKKTTIYFPFSNGPIIDKLINFFKGNNIIVFHSFEYNDSNLRASKFADIIIHPEKTRLKLSSFEVPHKKHFYFPNVIDAIQKPKPYPNISKLDIFANGRIKLLYQGLINVEKRCLKEILEALKEIESSYCLVIMPAHHTNQKELTKLEKIINNLSLENSVLFVPSMKSPDHLGIVNHIDIGIGLYKPSNINQYFAAPNRVFEINQFMKPLILPDNVGLKLLEYEYKGEVFCCDPSSLDSICNTIKKASELKSETKHLYDETGDFSIYFEHLNSLILSEKG
jgi:hypothetical protein